MVLQQLNDQPCSRVLENAFAATTGTGLSPYWLHTAVWLLWTLLSVDIPIEISLVQFACTC